MSKRNPIEAALRSLLEEKGLQFVIDNSRTHPCISFEMGGRHWSYFFPGTPAGPRSLPNNVAALRRLIRKAEAEASAQLQRAAR